MEVSPPGLDTRDGLVEMVADCLAVEWGVTVAGAAPAVLACAHDAVSAAGGLVTVAVRRHALSSVTDWPTADAEAHANDAAAGVLAAVWPGVVTSAFGIAIDIGSTTVAGHLADLHSGRILAGAGRMNPQIRLGEDLMSRVSYAMMHPDGTQELTMLIRRSARRTD